MRTAQTRTSKIHAMVRTYTAVWVVYSSTRMAWIPCRVDSATRRETGDLIPALGTVVGVSMGPGHE